MLRTILAVGAAILSVAVLTAATQAVLLRFFFHNALDTFDVTHTPAYILATGVCTLFFAVIGGCISAALGKRHEAPTILGALMLGMAIGGMVMKRGIQPFWYAATVPVIGAVIATLSGYTWLGRLTDEPGKSGRDSRGR